MSKQKQNNKTKKKLSTIKHSVACKAQLAHTTISINWYLIFLQSTSPHISPSFFLLSNKRNEKNRKKNKNEEEEKNESNVN